MKSVSRNELLSLADYERVRARLRPLFMAEKDRRRLAIGDHITLLFENGQTTWYQIQEMLRTERIADDESTQHEIDTYNELIPAAGELSATMLIEYPNSQERDQILHKLQGVERHLWIIAGGKRVQADFDMRQIATDQVSSVQFVRFPLNGIDPQTFLEFARADKITIEVDHPELRAHAIIKEPLARALAQDLRED